MQHSVETPVWYDCEQCRYRAPVGEADPVCPACGHRMQNISVPRE
jgi:rubrerythrin